MHSKPLLGREEVARAGAAREGLAKLGPVLGIAVDGRRTRAALEKPRRLASQFTSIAWRRRPTTLGTSETGAADTVNGGAAPSLMPRGGHLRRAVVQILVGGPVVDSGIFQRTEERTLR